MIQVQLYRSLATNNITDINQGFTRIWQDVTIKPLGGQGIQTDWSYHFHGLLLVSGSYGRNWPSNVISFFACSYKTQYELDPEKLLIIAQFLTKGSAWMIIGNQYDCLVVGRETDEIEPGFSTFLMFIQ